MVFQYSLFHQLADKIQLVINIYFGNHGRPKVNDVRETQKEKLHLLTPIAPLYLFPNYTFENQEEYIKKSKVVVDLMKSLLLTIECDDEKYVEYLASNFQIRDISNNEELYQALFELKESDYSNHTIFELGLRSIFSIMRNNLDQVSYTAIISSKERLKLIVPNFDRKELLYY